MHRWWIVAAVPGMLGVPAVPAGAQQQNPFDVIEQWESAGYQVNIDRIGSAPIGDCVVIGVRNPQQVTQPVLVIGGRDDEHGLDVVDVVVHRSISVSLDCTG